jgi:hypothetical protein
MPVDMKFLLMYWKHDSYNLFSPDITLMGTKKKEFVSRFVQSLFSMQFLRPCSALNLRNRSSEMSELPWSACEDRWRMRVIKTKCIEYVETTSPCDFITQRSSVLYYCDTHNSHKCVWDILGASDLWGCCCELRPRRMGLFESFPKEDLQRSDARNL